jgi:carbamoyltransferase
MEWGPRALGSRCFLDDPRREGMKDVINIRIKKKEPFGPFAPSLLEESRAEYFYLPGTSAFMRFVYYVEDDRKKEIPAVTHIKGTTPHQTVDRRTTLPYCNLIKEFDKITDVPVLLNTSFNIQEPIVCTRGDSIQGFLSSKADCPVMNNLFVDRLSQ